MRPSDLGCYGYGLDGEEVCYGAREYVVREANASFAELRATGLQRWSNSAPLTLRAAVQGANYADFALYTVAVVDQETGWAFLGKEFV